MIRCAEGVRSAAVTPRGVSPHGYADRPSARRKIDGLPFFFIPGHTSGAVYMTSDQNCTCPAAQHRSGKCKHSRAVDQHLARQATPAPKPAPKSYAALMDRHLGDD
jgi:hypothetical protein